MSSSKHAERSTLSGAQCSYATGAFRGSITEGAAGSIRKQLFDHEKAESNKTGLGMAVCGDTGKEQYIIRSNDFNPCLLQLWRFGICLRYMCRGETF